MTKSVPSAPAFFDTPAHFRRWLQANHAREPELLVGFWKKATARASITWEESVAEALCFGWIDGVRRSLGDEAYTIRFTPRRPGSIWSAKNLETMRALIDAGRVAPAGLAVYEARDEAKTNRYSFEREPSRSTPRRSASSGSTGRPGSSSWRSRRRTGSQPRTGS